MHPVVQSLLTTNLPKLQMPTGELVRPFAHFAFSFSQKNAAWVGRVCNQHTDPNPWTI